MSDSALRRSALVVAGFSSFLLPFMLSAVNIALPAIENDRHRHVQGGTTVRHRVAPAIFFRLLRSGTLR